MEIRDTSGFEVEVARTDLGQREVVSVVIVKGTFDVDANGDLTPSSAPMPLVKQVLETPFGVFHSEYFFKKQGVDLCVLGSVHRSRPVDEARVRMTCRHRTWELVVHGDRRWVRTRPDRLTPSRPQPFTSMPLGYSRAFGGQIPFGDLTVGYPANPQGRGYYRTIEEAEGQPLPNIEDGRRPTPTHWVPDEPPPVGWAPYPNFWALRANAGVQIDDKTGTLADVRAALFNHAHPDLMLDAVDAGDRLVIDGLQEERVQVRIPPPPAAIEVAIAHETRAIDAPIDGIFFWVDARKLVVTQRARFQYALRPEDFREVRVRRSNVT